MRFLFIGDVMGRSGRQAVCDHVPVLRDKLKLDAVVANVENAAGGFGITEGTAKQMFDGGVDVMTLGNHAWDQSEALTYIEREPRLIRPINYPKGTAPGKGMGMYDIGNYRIVVINAMGQLFMEPLNDPFVDVADAMEQLELGRDADAIIIDFHGEASSEKCAMGHIYDGYASLVVGTHTHVPTADTMILPNGTAYQSDAGMTGDYDSVIGMQKEEPIRRFTTRRRGGRFEPASGEATLCGVYVETDNKTGLAVNVAPVRVGGVLSQTVPDVG